MASVLVNQRPAADWSGSVIRSVNNSNQRSWVFAHDGLGRLTRAAVGALSLVLPNGANPLNAAVPGVPGAVALSATGQPAVVGGTQSTQYVQPRVQTWTLDTLGSWTGAAAGTGAATGSTSPLPGLSIWGDVNGDGVAPATEPLGFTHTIDAANRTT
ncbi:MAG: hypothetical protein ACKVS8_06645, partial [Phycisphaerales bacterium]